MATTSRMQVLKALGVMPLRLRAKPATAETPAAPRPVQTDGMPAARTLAASVTPDKRIALLRSQSEIEQPTLATLYTKITEAISQLGLQCVRIADAESDPRVRVLVFGDVQLPAKIEQGRVLRVDALAVLESDRSRKRALWELMQKLAREDGAG